MQARPHDPEVMVCTENNLNMATMVYAIRKHLSLEGLERVNRRQKVWDVVLSEVSSNRERTDCAEVISEIMIQKAARSLYEIYKTARVCAHLEELVEGVNFFRITQQGLQPNRLFALVSEKYRPQFTFGKFPKTLLDIKGNRPDKLAVDNFGKFFWPGTITQMSYEAVKLESHQGDGGGNMPVLREYTFMVHMRALETYVTRIYHELQALVTRTQSTPLPPKVKSCDFVFDHLSERIAQTYTRILNNPANELLYADGSRSSTNIRDIARPRRENYSMTSEGAAADFPSIESNHREYRKKLRAVIQEAKADAVSVSATIFPELTSLIDACTSLDCIMREIQKKKAERVPRPLSREEIRAARVDKLSRSTSEQHQQHIGLRPTTGTPRQPPPVSSIAAAAARASLSSPPPPQRAAVAAARALTQEYPPVSRAAPSSLPPATTSRREGSSRSFSRPSSPVLHQESITGPRSAAETGDSNSGEQRTSGAEQASRPRSHRQDERVVGGLSQIRQAADDTSPSRRSFWDTAREAATYVAQGTGAAAQFEPDREPEVVVVRSTRGQDRDQDHHPSRSSGLPVLSKDDVRRPNSNQRSVFGAAAEAFGYMIGGTGPAATIPSDRTEWPPSIASSISASTLPSPAASRPSRSLSSIRSLPQPAPVPEPERVRPTRQPLSALRDLPLPPSPPPEKATEKEQGFLGRVAGALWDATGRVMGGTAAALPSDRLESERASEFEPPQQSRPPSSDARAPRRIGTSNFSSTVTEIKPSSGFYEAEVETTSHLDDDDFWSSRE